MGFPDIYLWNNISSLESSAGVDVSEDDFEVDLSEPYYFDPLRVLLQLELWLKLGELLGEQTAPLSMSSNFTLLSNNGLPSV
jgi:hypothetical protein